MGAEQNIIVAFEFGSSAVCGIAGYKKSDGTLKILDIEIEKTAEGVRRGVIYNIDVTTTAITNIVSRMNQKLDMRVKRAYVGLGGQSLHTVGNTITRNLETTVKITTELMDNLNDNNLATEYADSKIYDVIPQEFLVGHHSVTNAVGIQTDKIEAHYVNVVARDILDENIKQCMQKAGLEIVDTFISPIALADSLLTDNEKRSGCALIDFGAGTTTVSLYANNILRHMTVLPLGGNNITADIVNSKQVYTEEAEALKRKYGVAYIAAETDKPQQIPISNNRTVDENDLQNIIGARQEEIIVNMWEQIKDSSEKLVGGIVTTGGAAQIRDMTEAIKHFTGFDRVKAAKSLIISADVSPGTDTPQDTNIDTLIALLMHGTENCASENPPVTTSSTEDEPEEKPISNVETPEVPEEEQPKKPTFAKQIRKAGLWLRNMLNEQSEEEED